MAKLTILHYPDPRLRKPALAVETVDEGVRALIDDLLETMYAAPGIGLAATQVNVQKRIVVMDVSEEKNRPLVFINPSVLEREGECESEEGCLSVPGFYEKVERASAPWTATAIRSNWRRAACWRSASSTRSIIWTANCSWITCRC